MSTRPPTLREKRRYLLVHIDPIGTIIDQKDLHYTISDATTSLWGDVVAAVITSAVVASEGQYFILRCRGEQSRIFQLPSRRLQHAVAFLLPFAWLLLLVQSILCVRKYEA